MPRGGKRQTSFDPERAREAAAKSAEVRRQKRDRQERGRELDVDAMIAKLGMHEWTSRQLVKVAGNDKNAAAQVAALKELRNRDTSPTGETAIVQAIHDARAELLAEVSKVVDRRRAHYFETGECLTCDSVECKCTTCGRHRSIVHRDHPPPPRRGAEGGTPKPYGSGPRPDVAADPGVGR